MRDCEAAVEEDSQADDRWQDEPSGVEAEPAEVEGQLLAKILTDNVYGLICEPVNRTRPVLFEQLFERNKTN